MRTTNWLMTLISFVLVSSSIGYADEKVGLVWAYYDDEPTYSTLYLADVTQDTGPSSCVDFEYVWYWAPTNSVPCPWEVCIADFQYELVMVPDLKPIAAAATSTKTATAKLKPLTENINTFDRPFPTTLPEETHIKDLIPIEHRIPGLTRRWKPNRGIPFNDDNGLAFIQVQNGPKVAIRWFRTVPSRRLGETPQQADDPVHRRHRPLEVPVYVGVEVDKQWTNEVPITATLNPRSDYQAKFQVNSNGNGRQWVYAITRTDLNP